MKRNDDCGFTVVLCGRFETKCDSSRGAEHDEAEDGGEMKGDEEYPDSGVDEFDDSNIVDARALDGRECAIIAMLFLYL